MSGRLLQPRGLALLEIQTSLLRFIEDNWALGRIGDQSLDERAGSLLNLFDFSESAPRAGPLILDPATGLPQ